MKKTLVIFLSLLIIGNFGLNSASALSSRTIDGSGNNLLDVDLGTPGKQLLRIVSADYDDGIKIPRGGNNPSTLPSPREISNVVIAQSVSIPNPQGASDMLWQWGQFIDHDLDLTLTQVGGGAESFHIQIPTGDPIFDDALPPEPDEMRFTRSIFDPLTGTDPLNPREQTNAITAFIDGSMVYGSDTVREDFLRDPTNPGKLKLVGGLLPVNDAMPLLPNGNGPPGNDPADMFVAGDVRVNEQVGLTVIHTLFVREHNWLVDKLVETGEVDENDYANENDYSDALYQNAKAIVEGEIQHITYEEFLPMILGSEMLDDWVSYDPNVDPRVSTEFSTAGFRVGHTMLSSELERFNEDGTVASGGHLSLASSFFNPQIVKDDGIEPILRGLVKGKSEKIDNFVIDEVRNFLFGEPIPVGGFDLASLNIQRGRDHGIPSYNVVRQAYGLPVVNDYSDITNDMVLADKFELAYGDGNVNDVDLWVGGISEPPVANGMVGPTFAAIIKDQFERSRDGDRYWYENREDLSDFQIDMIKQTRLSDIIVRNAEMSMGHSAFLSLSARSVGGTSIPIDATALLIAGISTDYFIMIAFSAVAAVSFAVLYYMTQRGKDENKTNTKKFSYNY
ncbi:MAG TPA: peroxidase family protein [Nitrosopumilaceae archaeon]|nr:peroxidase family protein [Nitrosopumilaceae archaeon]